jgi:hypothetical protein
VAVSLSTVELMVPLFEQLLENVLHARLELVG